MSKTIRNTGNYGKYLLGDRHNRDKKPNWKPGKEWKSIRQRKFRAMERETLCRIDDAEFELNLKTDVYLYN